MVYGSFVNFPTGMFSGAAVGLLVLLGVWDLAWKAWGMWHAARNNQVWWFIAILLLNTIGILPILYIYVFSKKGPTQPVSPQQ